MGFNSAFKGLKGFISQFGPKLLEWVLPYVLVKGRRSHC